MGICCLLGGRQSETAVQLPRNKAVRKSTSSVLSVTVEGESQILDSFVLKELIQSCPESAKLYDWTLKYSTSKHGIAMQTFYMNVKGTSTTILLVRDMKKCVFGAYCAEEWMLNKHIRSPKGTTRFYGTHESFVFTVTPIGELNIYRAARLNTTFQSSSKIQISIGVGDDAALILRENFSKCDTYSSSTFNSPPLVGSEKAVDFDVDTVEVWGISTCSGS